jgi:hypothetical protein
MPRADSQRRWTEVGLEEIAIDLLQARFSGPIRRHYFPIARHPAARAWPFVSIRFALAFRCRKDGTWVLTQSPLCEPSCFGHEVILFRDARCPACRNSVVFDGALIIADHF